MYASSLFEKMLQNNNLKQKLDQIRLHFCQFTDSGLNELHLGLTPFISERPFKYFDHDVALNALNLFRKDSEITKKWILKLDREISHAILSSIRSGKHGHPEDYLDDNSARVFEIENRWLPLYQLFSEHILYHLIQLPIQIISEINRKKFGNLTLSQQIQKMIDENVFDDSLGFVAVIRNGISHGCVDYFEDEIRFFDKKQSTQIDYLSFLKTCDRLVDSCNAIIFSIIMYVAENSKWFRRNKEKNPAGLKFWLLIGILPDFGFEITSILPSANSSLSVFLKTSHPGREFHNFICLLICWKFHNLGGGCYDRIIFNVDFGQKTKHVIFINNAQFFKVHKSNGLANDLDGVIEQNLYFHSTNAIIRKFHMLKIFARKAARNSRDAFITSMKKSGHLLLKDEYEIRSINNKTVGTTFRIEALVVIRDVTVIRQTGLNDFIKHIFKRLRKERVSRNEFEWKTFWISKRKASYIWVKIFLSDARTRYLDYCSKDDEKLLLFAEWYSREHKEKSIYVKEPHFLINGIRVLVNQNQLQSLDFLNN